MNPTSKQPAKPVKQEPSIKSTLGPRPAEPLLTREQKMKELQAVVQDAQRIMYSKETRAEFLKELQGDDIVSMSARTAVNLMLIMLDKTKMTLNPEVIIPAGVVIVGEILDFLEKTRKIKVSEQDIKSAIKLFCEIMVSKTSPQKKKPGLINQGQAPQQPQQPQQPQRVQPQAPQRMPQGVPAQGVPAQLQGIPQAQPRRLA